MANVNDKPYGLLEAEVKREEEEEEHAERAKEKSDNRQFADLKPEVSRIDIKAKINDDPPDDQNLCLTGRIPGNIWRML